MIEIHWSGGIEYLLNEERITWVTKVRHDKAAAVVIVNFSETGAEKTLHFRSDEGNLDQLYATIKTAMGTNRNKFRYTGKKD